LRKRFGHLKFRCTKVSDPATLEELKKVGKKIGFTVVTMCNGDCGRVLPGTPRAGWCQTCEEDGTRKKADDKRKGENAKRRKKSAAERKKKLTPAEAAASGLLSGARGYNDASSKGFNYSS
jgi:hypothetical protein